jgi:hypothetical protein
MRDAVNAGRFAVYAVSLANVGFELVAVVIADVVVVVEAPPIVTVCVTVGTEAHAVSAGTVETGLPFTANVWAGVVAHTDVAPTSARATAASTPRPAVTRTAANKPRRRVTRRN